MASSAFAVQQRQKVDSLLQALVTAVCHLPVRPQAADSGARVGCARSPDTRGSCPLPHSRATRTSSWRWSSAPTTRGATPSWMWIRGRWSAHTRRWKARRRRCCQRSLRTRAPLCALCSAPSHTPTRAWVRHTHADRFGLAVQPAKQAALGDLRGRLEARLAARPAAARVRLPPNNAASYSRPYLATPPQLTRARGCTHATGHWASSALPPLVSVQPAAAQRSGPCCPGEPPGTLRCG